MENKKKAIYSYVVTRYEDGSVSLDSNEVDGKKITEYEMYQDIEDVAKMVDERLLEVKIAQVLQGVLESLGSAAKEEETKEEK